MVERQREVLQHIGVLVFGIEFYAGLVVGYQVDFGLDAVVAADKQEVVAVQVELLVAYRRTLRQQLQAQALVDHRCRSTETNTHAPLVVVVAQTCQCAVLVDVAVNKGVEHKLRVLPVVAHLSLIRQTVAALRQRQAHGVDTGGVVVERVEVHLPVDTRYG